MSKMCFWTSNQAFHAKCAIFSQVKLAKNAIRDFRNRVHARLVLGPKPNSPMCSMGIFGYRSFREPRVFLPKGFWGHFLRGIFCQFFNCFLSFFCILKLILSLNLDFDLHFSENQLILIPFQTSVLMLDVFLVNIQIYNQARV